MLFEDSSVQAPSNCVQHLFGAFSPFETRRVLSCRQISKQKKINLSIIPSHNLKTKRKLTLSSNFLKQTVVLGSQKEAKTRANSHGQDEQSVTKNIIHHNQPAKVLFANPSPGQHKFSLSPEVKQFPSQGSSQKFKLAPFYQSKPNQKKRSHNLKQTKQPKFFEDNRLTHPETPDKNCSPKIFCMKEEQQSVILSGGRLNASSELSGDSEFYIKQISDQKTSSQKDRSSFQSKDISEMDRKRKITKLEEAAATVTSKYNPSSQKSESLCHSNVIFRLVGDLRFESETKERERKSEQHGQQIVREKLHGTDRTYNGSFRKIKQSLIYEKEEQVEIKSNESNQETINPSNQELGAIVSQSRLEKINYLGVCQFSNFYLVRERATNFLYSMKQILKFTIKCNKLEEQLLKEIKIQSMFNHPNIVSLYSSFADHKKWCLIFEAGEDSLLNLLREKGSLPEKTCRRYLKQIATGLEAIHSEGIVHRDIKLQNIVLVNGVCKIGNFFWAERMSSEGLSSTGGTSCYASPQIHNQQVYSQKTDCYSLGILAYELIVGVFPETVLQGEGISFDSLDFSSLNISQQYREFIQLLMNPAEHNRPTSKQILNHQFLHGFP